MNYMSEFWDKFVYEFCKVEFVCWNGELNWLGWVFIVLGLLILLFLLLIVLSIYERTL